MLRTEKIRHFVVLYISFVSFIHNDEERCTTLSIKKAHNVGFFEQFKSYTDSTVT